MDNQPKLLGAEEFPVNRVDALSWIFEFIYKDLQPVTFMERFQITDQLLLHLYSRKLRPLTPDEMQQYEKARAEEDEQNKIPPRGLRKHGPAKNAWRVGPFDYHEDIITMDNLLEDRLWDDVLFIQAQLKEFLENKLFPFAQKGSAAEGRTSLFLHHQTSCSFYLVRDENMLSIRLHLDPAAGEQHPLYYLREAWNINLYEILDNFPVKSILRCKECTHLFVQHKGKKREFCSDKCLNRWHVRKNRRADPEKYRERQKLLMRKRYKEKASKKQN